jgi:CRISPR/Cas system CSM-associated protein Csm3 (group 7 of RAMP superfamily)
MPVNQLFGAVASAPAQIQINVSGHAAMSQPYRTLFVGTLVQDSFLSVGGTDDPTASMDSPFCLDGRGHRTLRGTGLAGALVATLRRILNPEPVPKTISGSNDERCPSVWRCFNSHPLQSNPLPTVRQHVAIDARTGGAATGMLFDVETLPPQTRWSFLLEVDTSRDPQAADLARQVLVHWAAGRCLLGREVARGLGWLRLDNCHEYPLTTANSERWPQARAADRYPQYIAEQFAALATPILAAPATLPGWCEISGTLSAGEYRPTWHGEDETAWGLDSLSIGGHASEEVLASWNDQFLAPDGLQTPPPADWFDPDFAVVTSERQPYIPGSSLRGALRHALTRLVKANGQETDVVKTLFGTFDEINKLFISAKLLICDAFPDNDLAIQLAWFQHHAEDEFAASTYDSGKFDRVAVVQGQFRWRMVVEDADAEELAQLKMLLALAQNSQIGLGGGQWRGHGWLHWRVDHNNCAEDAA